MRVPHWTKYKINFSAANKPVEKTESIVTEERESEKMVDETSEEFNQGLTLEEVV